MLLATSFVFAKDITLTAGGKTFELKLAENSFAQSFIKNVNHKNLRFTEYGGFEYYTTNELPVRLRRKMLFVQGRLCLLQHYLPCNFDCLRKPQSFKCPGN